MKKILMALSIASTFAINAQAADNNFTCNFVQGDNRHGQTIKYNIKTNQYGQIESTYISLPLYAIATGPLANTNSQIAYRKQIMLSQDGSIPPDGAITSFYGVNPGEEVTYKGNMIYGISNGDSIMSARFDSNTGKLEIMTQGHNAVHKSYHWMGSFWQCYRSQNLVR